MNITFILETIKEIQKYRANNIEEMIAVDFYPMRLLDNVCRVVLEHTENGTISSTETKEFSLLLNVVICGVIRECVEEKHGKHNNTNYPFISGLRGLTKRFRCESVKHFNAIQS